MGQDACHGLEREGSRAVCKCDIRGGYGSLPVEAEAGDEVGRHVIGLCRDQQGHDCVLRLQRQ
jgi:hypothetical protein